MGAFTIPGNTVTTYEIQTSNSVYTLAAGGSIDTTNFGGDGIEEDSSVNEVTININGLIQPSGFNGIQLFGQNTDINVGKDAIIHGDFAIYYNLDLFTGPPIIKGDNIVTNLGQIIGDSTGIFTQDPNTSIINSGLISGADIAINCFFQGFTVKNLKGGKIVSDDIAIHSTLVPQNGKVVIVNNGSISGVTAFDGDDGVTKITNNASIKGDIIFGGGIDTLDTRKGTVSGHIYGGDGKDKLMIGKGNNILSGADGDGKNDGDSDRFVFVKGFDKDEITDFVAKGTTHDVIDFKDFGFKSFSALKQHIHDEQGDAVIDLGRGDVLTLDDVAAATLRASDFLL
jgi:hypothetical protein